MPEGDNELGNHLMTKWCTEASACVVFKTDWFKLRPLFQPYMRNHSTLIWERALLITKTDTSLEPALLVTGELLVRSLGTGSCQVGRPRTFLWGTGHTAGTPCQWYVMNMGVRLHNFKL